MRDFMLDELARTRNGGTDSVRLVWSVMHPVPPRPATAAAPDFAALLEALDDGERQPNTATDTKVLDATLRVLCEVGERRLTVDDVSALSRISRSTIFRRFGSKEALLQQLYEREVLGTVRHVRQVARQAPDAVSAVIAGYTALVDHASGHPLIRRQVQFEPGLHVALWRAGGQGGHEFIQALITGMVSDHDDAHQVDAVALRQLSDLLARMLFAEMLLPGPETGCWADTARGEKVNALIELQLRGACGQE